MKLDRNIPEKLGCGKYALILLRKLDDCRQGTFRTLPPKIEEAFRVLQDAGLIDEGNLGTNEEFFVMRLKDRHAEAGLAGYGADAWRHGDREWAKEVWEMADRAGPNHPACKLPD